MNILRISAHYHDSAAALVVDGMPVCAVQEERLSRHKNDAGFPASAIEWCLNQAAIDPAELDAVVFYERSMLKFERILTCALRSFPRRGRPRWALVYMSVRSGPHTAADYLQRNHSGSTTGDWPA